MLAHPTIPEAAKACGVGESTLWRWLQDADFQAAYRQARRQVVEKAIAQLQNACADAVDALTRNLKCGVPAAEIAAARTILDQATKGIELADLIEQVEQLKTLIDSLTNAGQETKKCA